MTTTIKIMEFQPMHQAIQNKMRLIQQTSNQSGKVKNNVIYLSIINMNIHQLRFAEGNIENVQTTPVAFNYDYQTTGNSQHQGSCQYYSTEILLVYCT